MSVRSAPYYWLVCDAEGCSASSADGDTEFSAYADESMAVDEAESSDWGRVDGLHYCPEHYLVCWDCDRALSPPVVRGMDRRMRCPACAAGGTGQIEVPS